MATCRDCLHIDVCYMVEHYGVDIDEDRQERDCYQFQAKTNCVEVVRCKDCKHYMLWEDSEDKRTCAKSIGLMVSDPDDFCSYGERKDNG